MGEPSPSGNRVAVTALEEIDLSLSGFGEDELGKLLRSLDHPYNVAYGDHGGQQLGTRRRRLKNDAMPRDQWQAFCGGWAKNLLDATDGTRHLRPAERPVQRPEGSEHARLVVGEQHAK